MFVNFLLFNNFDCVRLLSIFIVIAAKCIVSLFADSHYSECSHSQNILLLVADSILRFNILYISQVHSSWLAAGYVCIFTYLRCAEITQIFWWVVIVDYFLFLLLFLYFKIILEWWIERFLIHKFVLKSYITAWILWNLRIVRRFRIRILFNLFQLRALFRHKIFKILICSWLLIWILILFRFEFFFLCGITE